MKKSWKWPQKPAEGKRMRGSGLNDGLLMSVCVNRTWSFVKMTENWGCGSSAERTPRARRSAPIRTASTSPRYWPHYPHPSHFLHPSALALEFPERPQPDRSAGRCSALFDRFQNSRPRSMGHVWTLSRPPDGPLTALRLCFWLQVDWIKRWT